MDTTKVWTSEEVYSHGSDFQNEDEQDIRSEYLKVVAAVEFRIYTAELLKKIQKDNFFKKRRNNSILQKEIFITE